MSALNTITEALKNVLPSFNKTNGSIEAKIIDVVGTFADTEIIERKNSIDVINKALANQKITTVEYYRRKAVAFQYGDPLIYDPINQGGYYEPVDPTKCIIKQANIVGAYPQFTLLVNALDESGHLRKLTDRELSSFNTYFSAFIPMGLVLNITSMEVAKITDPNVIIYVRTGSDAEAVAKRINATFKERETVLRSSNTVSLTEIEDTIQQQPEVQAVGFDNIVAKEAGLDGVEKEVRPVKGIFSLTNGAFTFATEIMASNIKVLQ